MVWVVFYTSRSSTGEPNQQYWGDPDNPIYLKDHWHISWSRDEAVKAHQDILEHYDVHVSGIAPIDPEYHYDWSDAEDERPEIVRCENGVGEWEISPLHDTFDIRQEAEQALKEVVLGDVKHKRLKRDVRVMLISLQAQ
jgi:hypothetical protein